MRFTCWAGIFRVGNGDDELSGYQCRRTSGSKSAANGISDTQTLVAFSSFIWSCSAGICFPATCKTLPFTVPVAERSPGQIGELIVVVVQGVAVKQVADFCRKIVRQLYQINFLWAGGYTTTDRSRVSPMVLFPKKWAGCCCIGNTHLSRYHRAVSCSYLFISDSSGSAACT
jgi:hypothetical protein